jgi:protein SCO1
VRWLRVLQAALFAALLAEALFFGLLSAGLLGPRVQRTTTAETPSASQIGGPFHLTSHTGETVTDQDLKGKPFAVFFGFTHCPDVCPTTLSDITSLLKELGPDGDKITPVFITVDPERDTKSVLAEYMQAFDPRILGLTGTLAEVDTAAKAYKAIYRKVPTQAGDYTMEHTAIVYLMSKEGRMASSLDSHEPMETRLTKLKRLIAS